MNRKPIGLTVPYRPAGRDFRELNCHGVILRLAPRYDGKWEWVVDDKELAQFQEWIDEARAKDKK